MSQSGDFSSHRSALAVTFLIPKVYTKSVPIEVYTLMVRFSFTVKREAKLCDQTVPRSVVRHGKKERRRGNDAVPQIHLSVFEK